MKIVNFASIIAPAFGAQQETTTMTKMAGSGWCSAGERREWRSTTFTGSAGECKAKCEGDSSCLGYWQYVAPSRWAGHCTLFSSSKDFEGPGFTVTYDRQGMGFAKSAADFVLAPVANCECWRKQELLSKSPKQLAKPMQGPQQGVDGTFMYDTKTKSWVPTKKTWEDMVQCPDLGLDDSCLARKSQCNMRHNTYKETGKGPKYIFDAGEECCCGERQYPPEKKCNPKECPDWTCKDWCKCFKAEPKIVEIFEGPNPSQWDLDVRELCPADNDECDCTPFLHGNAKEERLTRGAPKVLTIADKRLASLQATGCPRKEPLPKWWAEHFDPQPQDPELRNMKGYCQYALPGKTYDAKKLDICCGEGKTCEVKSCRRLTEFVADPNEHVASMAEKRLATLQATGCPRTKKLPEWWVEHFQGQDGLKEMANMMGYCTYASTDKSTRDTSKQDICCGEGETCEVKSCTKQTKWSTRKDVEDLLMSLGAKSQIQIVTDLSGNEATRAASCEPPKVKCHSKHGYHCVSEYQCDRMNRKELEWIMPTV